MSGPEYDLPDDAAFLAATKKLYEVAPFGYLTTSDSGDILVANEALSAWLGYTSHELQSGIRLVDLLTPGGRMFYETHLALILTADSAADEIALEFVRRDGSVVPALVNARQVRSGDGTGLNRWIVFKASARRLYERELLSARNLFETTLASIADGVVATDAGGAITFMNAVAAELTGWDPDLAVGMPIEDALVLRREDTGEAIESPIRQALRTQQKIGLENHTTLVTPDGKTFPVDDSAAPILDENGSVCGAVMVFRDVTQHRKAERALENAHRLLEANAAELRRSNEDLSQFAYAASHDLRSPLKTVAMYSQLLQRRYADSIGSDGKELLLLIETATRRMGALIEDLLAFSTVSAKREYSTEPVDADGALRTVIANLRGIIAESGAVVESCPLPKVGIDETSLIQVFQNLVANAIRYRSSAIPRVRISAEREGDFWRFRCSDNGIGIPDKYFATIFEPFKRLHGQDVPGSGIGLALCKKLVERYGGRIWVESKVGVGSTFHFTLPISKREVAERATA